MDNLVFYGLRPYKILTGFPNYLTKIPLASASFDVNGGAANVSLVPGDVLISGVDQAVTLCDGTEGSGGAVDPEFVMVAPGWQYDATTGKMELKHGLASDIAWTGDKYAKVYVLSVKDAIWEACCDAEMSPYTKAGFQAIVGQNVSLINSGGSGAGLAKPLIDISTVATTNTLEWRIAGVSPSFENRDFAGKYVRLLLTCNTPGGSTTGA